MDAICRLLILPVVFAMGGGTCQTAVAKRIINAHIAVLENSIVLMSSTSDDGNPDSDAVWGYLQRVPFGDAKKILIRPDPGDPLSATLRGDIEVAIEYGGSIRVSSLTLVRTHPGDAQWTIASEQVQRTLTHRNTAYPASRQRILDLEAEQRETLWDALHQSLPEGTPPIRTYAENKELTQVCFRRQGSTYLFDYGSRSSKPVIHAKVLPEGSVNRITFEGSTRRPVFVLWRNGRRKVTVPAKAERKEP